MLSCNYIFCLFPPICEASLCRDVWLGFPALGLDYVFSCFFEVFHDLHHAFRGIDGLKWNVLEQNPGRFARNHGCDVFFAEAGLRDLDHGASDFGF